ncbi:methionyl-tRNA formyltransferase [Desulfofustis limnaeus]|uniref:methionyl-tRNA formyltransferase n=1 Tax=Desulfofustis limnaeus TaxID=2740163 RepID=A0ABM7WAC1_9BACT|nr:methionyl-tRNA formyltransferase [Desulfofustis limnaeus]MDX9896879.1 methionyl-tRNA formyltransferase [Desulfofustis sp.]BDD87907.1 methionyl-tRNA formyltransferase [Desulfofustis limnaeus]
MRIVFIGQAPFGAEALNALGRHGEQIAGVITVPDSPQQRQANPVRLAAEEQGLPLLQTGRLKSPEAISWVENLAPDLLVLAFVTSFVPPEMITAARLGGINYHPSLLPKYRGGSAINWAVINGEQETGVTIHFIDEGVDTGPILLQRTVTIAPDDTVKSLYFGKLYPLGITMIGEAVRLLRSGEATATPQNESLASFQPVIRPADTIISWERSTAAIYNLIRGADPSPGATTCLNGTLLLLFDAAPATGQGLPGTVLTADDSSFTVATGDGALAIRTVRPAGAKKMAAGDYLAAGSLSIGARFTTPIIDPAGKPTC